MGRLVSVDVTLVCAGRPVRRFDNTPAGEECGDEYAGPVDSARVAGWRVGPARDDGTRPAMCPGCARPGVADEDAAPVLALEPLPGL